PKPPRRGGRPAVDKGLLEAAQPPPLSRFFQKSIDRIQPRRYSRRWRRKSQEWLAGSELTFFYFAWPSCLSIADISLRWLTSMTGRFASESPPVADLIPSMQPRTSFLPFPE
ncbi:MAG: hypothetical protein ACK53L_28610, partial [Pirellulaceae bacterium]